MVNETVVQSTGLELATFGEVLYAFSSLRSTSTRRRSNRSDHETLPWRNAIPDAPIEYEAAQLPKRALPAPPQQIDARPARRVMRPRRPAGRCHCGQCRNCMENARWERIFQEKFANADYYHHDIRIRYASPLSSI